MYMINDLLDLSRAEIGALSLYFEQVQPRPFLDEMLKSFAESEMENSEVKWVLEVPDRLPVIRADVVRLRQILTNLLVNARKFTRQGSITLGAAVEPPYLHLWVHDTGSGVPFERQEQIFQPFSTSGRRRRPEGIGLGLSITRHLIALHGGSITLESQPGRGSLFNVYLPLPGVALEPLPAGPSDGQSLMLVISTESHVPHELQQICERQNCIPHLIATRDHLNRALTEGKPTVVAWDLAHASSNEWNLINYLSSNQDCSALPIILYGMEHNGDELNAGLTNIVFKPCPTNTLKSWIAQIDPCLEVGSDILVVDDDPDARAYYQKLLKESHPFNRIILAENGSQALQILKNEAPGLILLDLMMPKVDGFAVLENLRSNPRTQCVPVIIISGKLLNYEDIQRLNHMKTIFLTKGILNETETIDFLSQIEGEFQAAAATDQRPDQTGAGIFTPELFQPDQPQRYCRGAVGVSGKITSVIFSARKSPISPWGLSESLPHPKSQRAAGSNPRSITSIATWFGFNDSSLLSAGCSENLQRNHPRNFANRRSKRFAFKNPKPAFYFPRKFLKIAYIYKNPFYLQFIGTYGSLVQAIVDPSVEAAAGEFSCLSHEFQIGGAACAKLET